VVRVLTTLCSRTCIRNITTIFISRHWPSQSNNENKANDSPIFVLYLVGTLELVVIGRLTHFDANTHSYTQQLRHKKEKNGRDRPCCGQKPVLTKSNKINNNGFVKGKSKIIKKTIYYCKSIFLIYFLILI
jgi:hypothetical protein